MNDLSVEASTEKIGRLLVELNKASKEPIQAAQEPTNLPMKPESSNRLPTD